MYCSSCGVAVVQGLSYCNYCGAKLSGANGDEVNEWREVKPGLLVAAMTGLFIFGLVAITMLLGMMKAVLELPVEHALGFALLPFLLLLLLEVVFMRLLLRRRHGAEDRGDAVLSRGQATKELDAAQARALPEPLTSVTEHTTRTFEPVYRDRNSK
jgi:hypothetical protein